MIQKLTMKLILFCLTLSPFCQAFGLFDFFEKEVELLPNNPKICTGQNITLVCNILSTADFNSSSLVFKVGSKDPVDHSDKLILNDTTAAMTFWNTKQNNNEHVCCMREPDQGEPDSSEMGCQTIQTFDYPVPIDNITCVVNDWNQSMNCTWSPADYVITPSIIFDWRIRHLKCNWTECPDLNSDYNYCHWSSTSVGDFSMKVLDLRVRVRARCGEEVTSYFTVNTKTIVKPAAASDVSSRALNSTCAHVSWTSTRWEYGKMYEVWHTSRWGRSPSTIIEGANTGKEKDNAITFCELIPNTDYSIHVRVKPARDYWSSPDNRATACGNCSACTNTADVECTCLEMDGVWSDTRTTVAKTYGDVPSASPAVSPGGYRLDPGDCDGNGVYRATTVYWQHLNDVDKNGDITAYEVWFLTDTEKNESSAVAGYATYETKNILCNTDYAVTIQARNTNGTSPLVSTFNILSWQKMIHPPEFMVEMSNVTDDQGRRMVYVQWGHVARMDVTGYTVYTCKKDGGECQEGKSPSWQTVDKSVNSTRLELTTPEDYLYGVSLDTPQGSSGFTWQTCIYTKDVAPHREPTEVKVHAGIANKALQVTFERLTCKSGEPYIDRYLVQYCRGECCHHSCPTKETKETNIMLRDLEEEKYAIRVRGVTMQGELGPWSEVVRETPEDNTLKPGSYVGIAVGGVFVLVLVIAGAIFIIRCCRRRIKKTTSPGVEDHLRDLTLPEPGYENEDKPPYSSQSSVESGYVEDPTSPGVISPTSGNKFFSSSIEEEPEEEVKKAKADQLQRAHTSQQRPGEGYCLAVPGNSAEWQETPTPEDAQHPEGQVELCVGVVLHDAIPVPKSFQHMEENREAVAPGTSTGSDSGAAYMLATVNSGASSSLGEKTAETTCSDISGQTDNISGIEDDSYVKVTQSSRGHSIPDGQGGYVDNGASAKEPNNSELNSDYHVAFKNPAYESDASNYTSNQSPELNTEPEIVGRSESFRESPDDNAYFVVITGDRTEPITSTESNNNAENECMHDQSNDTSTIEIPDGHHHLGGSEPAEEVAEATGEIAERRLPSTKPNNGYISQQAVEAMNNSPTLPRPADSYMTDANCSPELNILKEVSECLSQTSSSAGSESRSSINDVDMLLEESSDTLSRANESGVANAGYVSESFANGHGSDTKRSEEPRNDAFVPRPSSPANPPTAIAGLGSGYVPQEFANGNNVPQEFANGNNGSSTAAKFANRNNGSSTAVAVHEPLFPFANSSGYVSPETAEAMSRQTVEPPRAGSSKSESSDSDGRDSSPDIVRADRNGNVDVDGQHEDSRNLFDAEFEEFNFSNMNAPQPSTVNPIETQGGRTGSNYVSAQFAEDLLKRQTNANLNVHSTGAPASRAIKPPANGYVMSDFIENQRL